MSYRMSAENSLPKLLPLFNKRPYPVIPRRLRWAGWLAAVFGGVAFVMSSITYWRDEQLLKHGTVVDARIQAFKSIPSTRGLEVYEFDITCQDPASQKKYRKIFSTSSSRWQGKRPQVTTQVIYFPDEPARSEIAQGFAPNKESLNLMLIIFLAGLAFTLWVRHGTRKNLEWFEAEMKK